MVERQQTGRYYLWASRCLDLHRPDRHSPEFGGGFNRVLDAGDRTVSSRGGDYLPFLYLYLAAMTLPYIPGCGSFVFLQRWINDAHHAFVSLLSEQIRGKVAQYRSANA
ncbi:hypothetical protein [Ralstonia solanacearum]|uniref:hypothetical protein n=1 Tax=Ralstonia solanacearum TaxID=305 RepID=UPI001F099670